MTGDSEIWLKPVAMFKDPFRANCNAVLVLCETFIHDKVTPARYNFRHIATKVMDAAKDQDPWFGIEQEFFLTFKDGSLHSRPYQWPRNGYPEPQGQYYCGVGASNAIGRKVIEDSYRAFLFAGLMISGINAEVAPSQWEYQVGITKGIECGDHMWMARYIVQRVGENYGVDCDFEPKPVLGDWNGSGCHCNFSFNKTRQEGGFDHIIKHCMPKLSAKHKEHLALYGEGNEARLTGLHETSSMDTFTYHVRSRGASVRIPVTCE